MRESKYRILFDYGCYEGMKFWDKDGYDSIDEAVKAAIGVNSGTPFLIVRVVDWNATDVSVSQ